MNFDSFYETKGENLKIQRKEEKTKYEYCIFICPHTVRMRNKLKCVFHLRQIKIAKTIIKLNAKCGLFYTKIKSKQTP